MARNENEAKKAIERLEQLFDKDILEASDEEILAEFQKQHGDPAQYTAAMRVRFEKTVIMANKERLKAARAALDTAAATKSPTTAGTINISVARRRLRGIFASGVAAGKLTIAARNESELTDADIITIIADLRELGLWPEDEDSS